MQYKTMGVLHSFMWNHVKYANMEHFTETVTFIAMTDGVHQISNCMAFY